MNINPNPYISIIVKPFFAVGLNPAFKCNQLVLVGLIWDWGLSLRVNLRVYYASIKHCEW